MLPRRDEDQWDLRTWLAIGELGRSDAEMGLRVAQLRAREENILSGALRTGSSPEAQDMYVALVRGLHEAMGSPEPMPLEHASAVLERFVSLVGPEARTA